VDDERDLASGDPVPVAEHGVGNAFAVERRTVAAPEVPEATHTAIVRQREVAAGHVVVAAESLRRRPRATELERFTRTDVQGRPRLGAREYFDYEAHPWRGRRYPAVARS
jgi:hypothetical protein